MEGSRAPAARSERVSAVARWCHHGRWLADPRGRPDRARPRSFGMRPADAEGGARGRRRPPGDDVPLRGRRDAHHAAPRRGGPGGRRGEADPRGRPQRGRRDRGPALLRPPRRRSARAAPRRLHRRRPGRDRPGRLDDHPAAREERVRRWRGVGHPQGPGGLPGLAARAEADEGADPHPVPQHGVLRQRRLRGPGRGRDLLRQVTDGPHAHRVRAPGRPDRGAGDL